MHFIAGSDEGEIEVFCGEAFRQDGFQCGNCCFVQIEIEDGSGLGALEMGMGSQIRAESGRRTVEVYLPDQTTSYQSLQAIVHGCQGYGRQDTTNTL